MWTGLGVGRVCVWGVPWGVQGPHQKGLEELGKVRQAATYRLDCSMDVPLKVATARRRRAS